MVVVVTGAGGHVGTNLTRTTRDAYADIIDGLRAKGFTLVTVPELLDGNLTPGELYYSR